MHSKSSAIGLFLAGLFLSSCVSTPQAVTTRTGLTYRVLAPGHGVPALSGQSVRIHETTTLVDGTLIFTTRAKNTPVAFRLGANQVIAGVDEGVTGMRVGERRKLIIPPSLSKRSEYPPNTPPDATLLIEVELVEVIK
jgi:FKBP-type peptidyl-prolyl cis-trans isomerase